VSFAVFLAVLAAAALHASWNAVIKHSPNKQSGMLTLAFGHAVFGIVAASFRPVPMAWVWPWIIGSALIHTVYQLFLAYAYEQGDLSRVYPIARGAAPLMVLIVGAVVLHDQISVLEYTGIVLLGFGILLMARGVWRGGESRRLLPFALGSALATASYTLVDGVGARISADPVAFIGWLMICSAAFYAPTVVWLRGPSVLRLSPKDLGLGLIGGAASILAYGIAVWAMTQAPIALVAALRETSILFAVLIGWLVFAERMDRGKALAAALIVIGVAVTRA